MTQVNGDLLLDAQKSQASEPSKLEVYRQVWLEAVKENADAGRTALVQKFRRIYSWLYVYDKNWLKAHLPPCKKIAKFSPQVDWKKRDTELAAAVQLTIQRLKTAPGRLVKVTKTAIVSDLGQLRLIYQHKDKLPLTISSIEELTETREEFAIRRIQWATKYFCDANVCPKQWELLRQAGIKPDLAEVLPVKEVIATALKAIDQLGKVQAEELLELPI
jgi:hypothetical protein